MGDELIGGCLIFPQIPESTWYAMSGAAFHFSGLVTDTAGNREKDGREPGGGLKEHVHLVHSWCGPSESQEVQRSQGGVPRDDLIQRRTIDGSAQWAKEGRNLQLY